MSDRYDAREPTNSDATPPAHEPERSEYAEFQMRGNADSDGASHGTDRDALFTNDQADQLRRDWEDVQAGFVDDPRRAVKDADQLVEQSIQQITETFARERRSLEQQWDSGDDVSTEELRVVLQRYRSFFNRLLSV